MLIDTARRDELGQILQKIASEAPSETAERAATTFDNLAGPYADQIVLFGAGTLGKITLSRLQSAGIEPLAFADNDAALWGQRIEGIEVFSRDEAVERFGKAAVFVVTIYNGAEVRAQLRQAGCERVVPFTPLWWKYADAFLPDLGIDLPGSLMPHAAAIRKCYDLVADDISRKEILDQLHWRFWLDEAAMSPPLPHRDIYFPNDLISPAQRGEVYVDCGAFDGGSIHTFLEHCEGPISQIYATEPDKASRSLLRQYLAGLPEELREKVTIWPYALGKQRGTVRFAAVGDVMSKVGEEGVVVECRTLDDLPWSAPPTYIKMDIEGAEPEAIAGGVQLLEKHKPVLVACLYHRSEHLWQIPLLIHFLAPDYKLYLRRYAQENWETVCYAVPPNRVRR